MRILEIRTLHGPNYWSNYWKKLVVLCLDIGRFEHLPTNLLPGFHDRLRRLMPSLEHHQCSYHCAGGFLRRVHEGTWAGHVVEHLALELQTLAGMETGFGRTRRGGADGVYTVVFEFVEQDAGLYAGRAAVDLFLALAAGSPEAEITRAIGVHLARLGELKDAVQLGPTTSAILREAERRGIPVIRLNDRSLLQLGYGACRQYVQASVSGATSLIASEIASDKDMTKRLLADAGIPVPAGCVVAEEDELDNAIAMLGVPLAVKPLDANQGKGVSLNLRSVDAVRAAFHAARAYSGKVIVETHLSGNDFRVLVVDHRFVAAAQRVPAHVIGDGTSTIAELVRQTNSDPLRGDGHQSFLTQIKIDHQTLRLFAAKDHTPQTVLPAGEICYLKATSNLSTGGTAIDRTDEVHPENRELCERVTRLIGLDIAGIDLVAPDLARPLRETGGAIVEVNASPGLRMHLAPSRGAPRNVAAPIIDMLFPAGKESRIPIVAVTGTNGKTVTTRLIAHLIGRTGRSVGCSTSDGVFLRDRMIAAGDSGGPVSARMLLRDPAVEVAVLETAREGILRSGLGFDKCTVGVVTNVSADHVDADEIATIQEMARVKSVVAHSVARQGYAVLNADDPLVLRMAPDLDCAVLLFSLDADNPDVRRHAAGGGMACVVQQGTLTLLRRGERIALAPLDEVPLTFSGRAPCMVQDVLAAAGAAAALGLDPGLIREGLRDFHASAEQAPGRFNLLQEAGVSVLVDHARNPAALAALGEFLRALPHQRVTGVIGAPADRRDADIRKLGRIAASLFSWIVIKEEADLGGRTPGQTAALLLEGVRDAERHLPVQIIQREEDAILLAVRNASVGELIVALVEQVSEGLSTVRRALGERHAPAAAGSGLVPLAAWHRT